jgi:hypothetical protein
MFLVPLKFKNFVFSPCKIKSHFHEFIHTQNCTSIGSLPLEQIIMSLTTQIKKISVFGATHMMLSNGQGLPITSIGATSFHSLHNPHTTLTLKYLLLVLNITKNLIFVSQFAKITMYYFFLPWYMPCQITGYLKNLVARITCKN